MYCLANTLNEKFILKEDLFNRDLPKCPECKSGIYLTKDNPANCKNQIVKCCECNFVGEIDVIENILKGKVFRL